MITNRLSGLSIVVPVYNEEKTVVRVLSDLLGLEVDFPLEIIVVDDGSSDGTAEKIKGFEIDHIKPAALGGDSSPENLQVLCRKCNNAKRHYRM